MKVYLAARYQERRNWALAHLGGVCTGCGAYEDLQFDHKDRKTKSHSVSKMWLGSMENLVLELDKCQLLCAPCHLEKTRSDIGVPHGGGKKGKRDCKCPLCRERRRRYVQDRRAKLKILAA